MCLIAVAHRVHPDTPLVVAANRDEFVARPTAPAGFWAEEPSVLGGRDLAAGGTWLGVTRTGRFATVTNVREPRFHRDGVESRGTLVSEFVADTRSATDFAAAIETRSSRMNGFNLLLHDGRDLVYVTNRGDLPGEPTFRFETLDKGVYGLSNAALDTPWPKVRRLRDAVREIVDGAVPEPEVLLGLLADESVAPDPELPDTGVGLERERALSPARIRMEGYGTRASTVVLYHRDGHVTFVERTWPRRNGVPETRRYRFKLNPGETP